MNPKRDRIYQEIETERERQDSLRGEQNHPLIPEGRRSDGLRWSDYFELEERAAKSAYERAERRGTLTWYHILREEYYEVLAAATLRKRREELVQMLAVGTAMGGSA
jgi:hypothetical protein